MYTIYQIYFLSMKNEHWTLNIEHRQIDTPHHNCLLGTVLVPLESLLLLLFVISQMVIFMVRTVCTVPCRYVGIQELKNRHQNCAFNICLNRMMFNVKTSFFDSLAPDWWHILFFYFSFKLMSISGISNANKQIQFQRP